MHWQYSYNECSSLLMKKVANEKSLPSPILKRRKFFNVRKTENDLSASQLATGIMQPIENKRFRFGKVSWSQHIRDCSKVLGTSSLHLAHMSFQISSSTYKLSYRGKSSWYIFKFWIRLLKSCFSMHRILAGTSYSKSFNAGFCLFTKTIFELS